MNASSSANAAVLIIGAGPTGLVLALWLSRLGVRVRIIDKSSEAGTTSRALAVQARTLEFYNQLGIAEDVLERGRKITAVNLWVKGKRAARAVFGELGEGISPFPYAFDFSQDEHERLLIDHLAKAGVHVERRTELLSFEDRGDRVVARLKRPDGSEESCEALYLAGCDGAHSRVREILGTGFPGGIYSHLFYVADAQGAGPAMNGEVHVSLEKTDFLAVFPMKGEGRARLVGTVRDEPTGPRDKLEWTDVNQSVIESMRTKVERVNWFSTYRVHHRVAAHFRHGRAFLLGDAAHIHSPVGGQGMNTGIGDAVNLAWKLAAVISGRADALLLESYEPERIAFARRLVATTDQAFTAVTSPRFLARLIRVRLVPLVLPLAFKFKAARKYLFRTVSQTLVNYRASSLSQGRAGRVYAGDRLPWIPARSAAERDNFALLASLDWQLHIYGQASSGIQQLCSRRNLALHVFPWRPEMGRAGLQRDALYLIRPDGYVAFAHSRSEGRALDSYLDTRKVMLAKNAGLNGSNFPLDNRRNPG